MPSHGPEPLSEGSPSSAISGDGPTRGFGRRARAVAGRPADLWVQRVDTAGRLLSLLDRLVPLACGLAGFARFMAVLGFVAAAVLGVGLAAMLTPSTIGAVVVLLVVVAVLALPGIVLLIFRKALIEVLALPDWLRRSPDFARTHATELARLVVAAKADGSRPRRRVGRDAVAAVRLLLEAKNDLPEYGTALQLINPLFLAGVGISLAAVVVELLLVPVLALGGAIALLVG